jgi:hypothetical protein
MMIYMYILIYILYYIGIDLFPNHSQLQLGYALTLVKCNKYTDARKHFKNSIDSGIYIYI